MQIRDLVGWAAWGSDGVDGAATRMEGGALLGLRIFGHEGALTAHCLLTSTVVDVTLEQASRRWLVRTTSGSVYRLGDSIHVHAGECEQSEPRLLRAA
jgi:hypothetical protein